MHSGDAKTKKILLQNKKSSQSQENGVRPGWVNSAETRRLQRNNKWWIQAGIARMEPLISQPYPLSSKYFLKKRGLLLDLVCRAKSKVVTPEQQQTLDAAHATFLAWCERPGIQPVEA